MSPSALIGRRRLLAAMIDRLVHYVEPASRPSGCYRLNDRPRQKVNGKKRGPARIRVDLWVVSEGQSSAAVDTAPSRNPSARYGGRPARYLGGAPAYRPALGADLGC
jgi:hypothetical protein